MRLRLPRSLQALSTVDLALVVVMATLLKAHLIAALSGEWLTWLLRQRYTAGAGCASRNGAILGHFAWPFADSGGASIVLASAETKYAMAERIDSASKLIAASPAATYRAFASAEALETWLPPEGMTGAMLDFRFAEGGLYRMRLTYHQAQHAIGKTSEDVDEVTVAFVKIVPDERIEQAVRFVSDDPTFAGEMRMTWTFEHADSGTRVTIRCTNVPTGIDPEDHQAGLNATLNNLAAYLAAQH